MSGQRVGYIRVSSTDQNPGRQLEGVALDQVFTNKASAKDTDRPQLKELLHFVRAGDTLVVHSMDRLARNLDDLRALVQGLTRKGVQGKASPWPSSAAPTKDGKRPSRRNGPPSSSNAPAPVFQKPSLPVTTGSAGRPSTSTSARQSWSDPLPCLRSRCAVAATIA